MQVVWLLIFVVFPVAAMAMGGAQGGVKKPISPSSHYALSPVDLTLSVSGSFAGTATTPALATTLSQNDERLAAALALARPDAQAYLKSDGPWTEVLEQATGLMLDKADEKGWTQLMQNWTEKDFALEISLHRPAL